ncbi:response regulator [Helicovermis profundi]|uniref:Stage 0 sporulation protein A homolog n=1 Tax=Helicovermis profundi TaxID=3065157 RepID=A0AAU9ENA1_9FIRM|nr:hypothetical protein HLPR_11070 [Clostridia bacterium S502]
MNILHLEYSGMYRMIIKDMIIKSGNVSFDSKKGSELFKILALNDIDLIITGTELSDMTGEDIVHEVKNSKFSNIPIIVISANEYDETIERFPNLHVDDYLQKQTLDFDRFCECIERYE